MQQDEKQNVSRETLEGSVDMLDIARVAQDVEAREFAGMGSLKLVAPAKVNLYLNVKGVREDGYHEVSTTMHALMLHDVLRMKIIPGTGEAVKLTTRSFEGLAPLDVDPQDNIVVKAILKLAGGFRSHAWRRGNDARASGEAHPCPGWFGRRLVGCRSGAAWARLFYGAKAFWTRESKRLPPSWAPMWSSSCKAVARSTTASGSILSARSSR